MLIWHPVDGGDTSHASVGGHGDDILRALRKLESMRADIAWLKERKVMAAVFGVLRADGTLDVERMRELVEKAGLRVESQDLVLRLPLILAFPTVLTVSVRPG